MMVKMKLDGAMDKSLVDQGIRNPDVTLHDLGKI